MKKNKEAAVITISILLIFVMIITIFYYGLTAYHKNAEKKLITKFDDNKTIYCGIFSTPVSKELGWKIEDGRVSNKTDSYDLSQSCKDY